MFQKKSPRKTPLIDPTSNIDAKTLVFDLDETLIRAQKTEPANGFDARINVIDN